MASPPEVGAVEELGEQVFAAWEAALTAGGRGDFGALVASFERAIDGGISLVRLNSGLADLLRKVLIDRIQWPYPSFAIVAETVKAAVGEVGPAFPAAEAWLVRYELALIGIASGASTFADLLHTIDERLGATKRSGTALEQASARLDAASVFEWLGDSERATDDLRIADKLLGDVHITALATPDQLLAEINAGESPMAVDQRQREREAAIWAAQTKAGVASQLGRHGEAAELFRLLAPALGPEGPSMLANAAAELIEGGDVPQALEILKEVEPATAPGGALPHRRAEVLGIEADAHIQQRNYPVAATLLQQALAEEARWGQIDLRWKLQWKQAVVKHALDDASALDSYCEAARTATLLRRAPLGYRLMSTSLRDKWQLFVEGIELATEEGRAAECCELIELVKARELLAVLSTPPSGALTPEDPATVEFDRITQQLDGMQLTPLPTTDANEVNRLLARRAELLAEIRWADPRWRQLTAPPPFDPERVLASLASRSQAAISLFRAGNRIFAVMADDGAMHCGMVRLTHQTESALEGYQRNLLAPRPMAAGFDPVRWGLSIEGLIPEHLLEPAMGARSLVVSPYGVLNLLPWSALSYGGGRLFERIPSGVLPNLACLISLAKPLSTDPTVSIYGAPQNDAGGPAPLPGMVQEVHQLAMLAGDRRKGEPKIGTHATGGALRELAMSETAGSILHAACHGRPDPVEPLYSSLVASDEFVDAAELARLRLRPEEVVLSACSTGWRPTEVAGVSLIGDDALGLPGAFLEGGARSVLVSIPPAADTPTAALMAAYYGRRFGGSLPLAALQQAQLEMHGRYPVYQWCGFAIYGCQ
jgi:hypothetical protein